MIHLGVRNCISSEQVKSNEDPQQYQKYSTSDSTLNDGRRPIERRNAIGAKSPDDVDEYSDDDQREPDTRNQHVTTS